MEWLVTPGTVAVLLATAGAVVFFVTWCFVGGETDAAHARPSFSRRMLAGLGCGSLQAALGVAGGGGGV